MFSDGENFCVCIKFSAETTWPETNFFISFINQKINSFLTEYYVSEEENIYMCYGLVPQWTLS